MRFFQFKLNYKIHLMSFIIFLFNSILSNEALSLQKKWALLNVTSIASLGTDDTIKNLLLTDSALYSIYSPIYPVYAQLIEAQSIDIKLNDSNKNETITNMGCSDYLNENLPQNYIALVSRGVCTFERKVQVAIANKALAIIIYNNDLDIITMYIRNSTIPNIMISQYVGNLLKKFLLFSTVYVSIKPGPIEIVHGSSLPSRSSIYFVAFAFLSLVLVTFIWLTVYYVQKFRYLNTKKRLDDKLKKATLKALSKMVVRKISNDDKELTEACAICLENYQVNDQIRELPCGHYFHQKDVDVWLLEHRNCPMCKINILQAFGIEFQSPENSFRRYLNNTRLRRLFGNPSTVEVSNEIVEHGINSDLSLQSISTSTNVNNFQVGQTRSQLSRIETLETLDSDTNIDSIETNQSTIQNEKVKNKPDQQGVLNSSSTLNEQNNKTNAKHSSEKNEINV
ncbi:unnamed protein product [Brachionus calyciflorus]|uniref:RING-type domain-containing protein n=1 Tax=Brachionus calyciflorus TaxID=104777 RepID=A0A813MV18_9BILA|nr:unnamed protein product [Brachionus calyciflorus]